MKACKWLSRGSIYFCALVASWASAQQTSTAQNVYSRIPLSWQNQGLSSSTGNTVDFFQNTRQWISHLQKTGFIDRSLPAPYRVAIPLMSFGGDAGPKLKMTYAHNMPGTEGGKGILFFITMETP
ncbi:MAG: hypothetical protein JWQ21_3524 [Herminiimonas sp.]|jgi:hypothetical protein|nr:hypothetical protein [Herminiimonas sp.]